MAVKAKICGLKDVENLNAAVRSGAAFVGFVFVPSSPRHVTPNEAGALARHLPPSVPAVAVMVDPADADIDAVAKHAGVSLIQLHGGETPARVEAVRARTGLKVVKAIRVGDKGDVEKASIYDGVADYLMFDTKPSCDGDGPTGGTGQAFDWSLVAGRAFRRPWFLAGGLKAGNVGEAVAISGAGLVDVSSGVELAPGQKNSALIAAFLDAVRRI